MSVLKEGREKIKQREYKNSLKKFSFKKQAVVFIRNKDLNIEFSMRKLDTAFNLIVSKEVEDIFIKINFVNSNEKEQILLAKFALDLLAIKEKEDKYEIIKNNLESNQKEILDKITQLKNLFETEILSLYDMDFIFSKVLCE